LFSMLESRFWETTGEVKACHAPRMCKRCLSVGQEWSGCQGSALSNSGWRQSHGRRTTIRM